VKTEKSQETKEKKEKKEEPKKSKKEEQKPIFSLSEEEPLNANEINKDKSKKSLKRKKGRKRFKFLLPIVLVIIISSAAIFYLESDFSKTNNIGNQDETLQDENKNNLKENNIQQVIPSESKKEKVEQETNVETAQQLQPVKEQPIETTSIEEVAPTDKESEKVTIKKSLKPIESGSAERSKKSGDVVKQETKQVTKVENPEIKEKISVPKTQEKTKPTEANSTKDLNGKIIISCAAVSSIEAAKKSVGNLKSSGLNAGSFYLPDYQSDAKPLYKVFVGPFNDRVEAQSKLDAVKKFYPEAYVQGVAKK
jgi:cell division septation protein DedD